MICRSKDEYFDKGIPDKGIKAKAYERSLDDEADELLPLETYWDVIEVKKIVEHKLNWPVFKEVFNIPEPGEKGLAQNLKWLERLNELRRISAHPSEKRHYKVDDFEYIDYVYANFTARMKEAENKPVQALAEKSETENDWPFLKVGWRKALAGS